MENRANRLVVVVYEDEVTRDAAVDFCDELVGKFWTKCSFDVVWYSFVQIMNQQAGPESACKAAEADIIVLATHPDGWVPAEVREWTERWIAERGDREGALVGLLDPSSNGDAFTNKYTWARKIAHRAGLDYLTQTPTTLQSFPDCLDSYSERAQATTSVLDEILRQELPRIRS